ncbi:MAG: AraC family transcriptional regulator [Verrucomicrobiota bacterium]|nr:AraC family transcriptional regulator [Verrucomicrobiota bacterium]
MAILSKRVMLEVGREHYRAFGLRPRFTDLAGRVLNARDDEIALVSGMLRRRACALQESINRGQPHVFEPAPGMAACAVGLEDRRMIHGSLLGGEVLLDGAEDSGRAAESLAARGMDADRAAALVRRLPVRPESFVRDCGRRLHEMFYRISGWTPELMEENRLKALQQEQLAQAIQDQRQSGRQALYAFEKERALLANIRAGDSSEARRILNEMLAAIYLSSPGLVVLRARVIELMSCLTRAAIEDNPFMESLIERNHAWTERLVEARNFEDLSRALMRALDDFIEGIYLHGMNRSNTKVRQALDFINRNYMKRISLDALAREAGLSASRLSHLLKEFTGRTAIWIVNEARVRHAKHLLQTTSKSCAEIAYEAGFVDQSYFIKRFRRVTGATPARYRRLRSA